MLFDSFLNSHKEKNYHFFKLDLISLIYNSDDAKKGHPNIIKSCLIKEM